MNQTPTFLSVFLKCPLEQAMPVPYNGKYQNLHDFSDSVLNLPVPLPALTRGFGETSKHTMLPGPCRAGPAACRLMGYDA
jgi:hypothetical protein